MSTDYRTELQRLVKAYDEHGGKWPDHHEQALFQAVKAARTALAQPEPEGVGERIASIATAVRECAFGWEPTARLIGNVCAEDVADLCGAVLTRYARPAIEPVPDTKAHELLNLLLDDLDALVDNSEGVAGLHLNGDVASWESLREGGRFETWLMRMDQARAFLDSTMDKPDDIATTIEPVPVSERPWERARWCDAEGRCWWGRVEGNPGNPEWFLAGLSEIEGFYEIGDWIVLLPHHALPVPTARRPKPPSAKQQALYALDEIDGYAIDQLKSYTIHDDLKAHVDTIRRALEAMPDDIT
jgi:hypothetical protein